MEFKKLVIGNYLVIGACILVIVKVMEFKELLTIFQKYQKNFYLTVAVFVLLGFLLFLFQPAKNVANLTLNVTRLGAQKTDSYRFDDFYRLQADERFADTVVRWLTASPRVTEDIATEAKVQNVSFTPERLSSQMIQVRYQVANNKEAKKIAAAAVEVLNSQTQLLNKEQQEENWFQIVGAEPVVADARISLVKFLFASLMLGIFFGAWAVLFKHYFSR